MARRKLSRQQAQRIRALQEQRRRRAETGEIKDSSAESGLGPEEQGLIIAHHGAALTVEADDGSHVRCVARQNLGALACGDRVIWQRGSEPDTGVIVALQARISLLARPGTGGRTRPLAANVDRIFVVVAAFPEPSEHLIDRYLVTAEFTGIAPVIVLNKIDIPDQPTLRSLYQRMEVYARIGYDVLYTSVTSEHGLDALEQALTGHISILVGQSGVGKSSLVNALLPQQEVRVGALSDSQLGRHTTTTATLYHVPSGGDLIDSPGVRDFGVWHIDPMRIVEGFREFAPFLGRCKFSDCRHRQEPECALRDAVAAGEIEQQRLQSYLQIMDELAERHPA